MSPSRSIPPRKIASAKQLTPFGARNFGSTSIIIQAIPRYGDLVYIDSDSPATGTDLVRASQGRAIADRLARLPKIFSSRSQPIPVRFNIRTRPRAHLRSRPNLSDTASTLAELSQQTVRKLSATPNRATARAPRRHAFRWRRQNCQLQTESENGGRSRRSSRRITKG